jgi:hypothetical protein
VLDNIVHVNFVKDFFPVRTGTELHTELVVKVSSFACFFFVSRNTKVNDKKNFRETNRGNFFFFHFVISRISCTDSILYRVWAKYPGSCSIQILGEGS